METIHLEECYYTALTQKEITALITDELEQNIEAGDEIRVQKPEPPMYGTYIVKNVKRIRVDEITQKMAKENYNENIDQDYINKVLNTQI